MNKFYTFQIVTMYDWNVIGVISLQLPHYRFTLCIWESQILRTEKEKKKEQKSNTTANINMSSFNLKIIFDPLTILLQYYTY